MTDGCLIRSSGLVVVFAASVIRRTFSEEETTTTARRRPSRCNQVAPYKITKIKDRTIGEIGKVEDLKNQGLPSAVDAGLKCSWIRP